MAANYTRLIEFKVKDTELNRAVNNLGKTLNKIDKTLVGIDKKLETIAKTRFKDIEKEAVKVEKSMLRVGKVYKKMLTPQGVARGAVSGVFGLLGLNKRAIAETTAKIGFLDAVVRRFTKREYGLGKAIAETTGAIGKAVSALDRYARSATNLIKTHSRLIDATGKLGLALGTVAAFTPQIYAAGKAWRQLEYDIRRVGRAFRDSGPKGVGALFPKGSMIGKWGRGIDPGYEDFGGEKIDKEIRKAQLKDWRKMGRHPGDIKSHVEGLTKVNKILGDNQKIQEGINAFTQRHVQATIAVRKAQTAVNHELLRAKATQALFNADIWVAQRAWNGLLSTLQKAGGLLGKLSFGLFTGKTAGSVGQAAGIIGASRGIEDLIQKVPLLSQTLKDNIQTFATWTRTVTEAIASVSIAYTGLSAALSAAKWVTGAVSGFVQWEKQAAQSVWNVQRAFNSLDQRMAANLDKNRNIATGFGGWISKALRGGEGRIEQKRTSLQGPTDQQRVSEELRQQTQYLVNRNTTAKDYITIQQRIYALEREQTKEINMRRQMEVKAGKPIREVYEKEVTAADEAIKRIDAMRKKSISNAIAANDRINSEDKKAALEKLRLEKEAVAQKAKELKMSQDILLTVKKHNRELRRARRIKRVEQRRQSAATRGRFTENLMLGAGFPLLFGGGAGAVGGGVLGAGLQAGMGSKGFGMQIFFSAIGQQIDAFVAKIGEVGKAFNAVEPNVTALIDAMGVQGTELGKQMKAYEQVASKEKSLAMATEQMALIIGDKGVAALKKYGEASTEWGNAFGQAMLRIQASVAGFLSWTGILNSEGGAQGRLNQTINRGDNPKINELQARIEKIRSHRGRLSKPKENELARLRREQLRIQREEVDPKNAELLKNKTINESIRLKVQTMQEERTILENTLALGTREAGIQAEIAQIVKAVKGDNESINEEQRKRIENEVRLKTALEEQVQLWGQIKDTLATGITDAVMGLIEGTKTLKESLAGILKQMASLIIQQQIAGLINRIPIPGLPGKRAKGGPVTGGDPYIVGEKGPELFVPKGSGTIVPNGDLGGGGVSVVVNVDATGGSEVQGDEPSASQLGKLIGAAVQAELIKQKRPGGILA